MVKMAMETDTIKFSLAEILWRLLSKITIRLVKEIESIENFHPCKISANFKIKYLI